MRDERWARARLALLPPPPPPRRTADNGTVRLFSLSCTQHHQRLVDHDHDHEHGGARVGTPRGRQRPRRVGVHPSPVTSASASAVQTGVQRASRRGTGTDTGLRGIGYFSNKGRDPQVPQTAWWPRQRGSPVTSDELAHRFNSTFRHAVGGG